MTGGFHGRLERIDDVCYRIPRSYKPGMRVEGRIFVSPRMVERVKADQAPEQVANVATLPGIQVASLAMPDIHWGYGFCIGGVCATDPEDEGVISPGGVGDDINCGVRLLRSGLQRDEVAPHLDRLVRRLFATIPCGPGQTGRHHFDAKALDRLMREGPRALVGRGLAVERDIEHTEDHGFLAGARPELVSERAKKRGARQCGTLGGGNHFVEIQVVDRVFDAEAAAVLGLAEGGVCISIHSGSRGLGYQVCDDALRALRGVPARYGIRLPDRQLACAPVRSKEGQRYLGAMRAAAGFAWCNRQILMMETRHVFAEVFERPWDDLGLELVYDVCHNIAKLEEHVVGDTRKEVCVHRKGATRAFPAGHPDVPAGYREVGQPVLVPGSMGTASWVLLGQPGSMEKTFGSACHGAGRAMSRTRAAREAKGRHIDKELAAAGVVARARGWRGLAEEQPKAYKDVDLVVEVVEKADLARKVARLVPIGVIKG